MKKLIGLASFAVTFAITGAGNFLRNQWNQYTAFGQFLFILALAAIAVDAGICYQYGSKTTNLHGYGFALVAIAFAVLPDVSSTEFRKGNIASGIVVAVLCVPLGIVAYGSHVGYGSGVRLGDMQQTNFHNTNLEGQQDDAAELKKSLAFFEKRRDALDAELTALVETQVNGWAVTTRPSSPTELDGLIEAKQLEAENEAKRRGCKAKCEARNRELAHLKALRGKAAEIEKNNEQHAATLEGLSKARNKVSSNTYQSSAVVNQNDAFAKIYRAFWKQEAAENAIKPDEVTSEFVNIGIMATVALAFMILAPGLMFAAGLNRKKEALYGYPDGGTPAAAPEPTIAASPMSIGAAHAVAKVAPVAMPENALAAINARRQRITTRIVGMRQSRIDSGLLAQAVA